MTREEVFALITRARHTNDQRTASEHEHGWASPDDLGTYGVLDTALIALEAGMVTEDWSCIAEAYVFVESVVRQLERR